MRGLTWLLSVVLSFASGAAGAQQEATNMPDAQTQEAISLMQSFAERTGLGSERPRKRYLWTDAFAVCNFLGLARLTGDKRYTQLALQLVDQVHHTLGRQRDDAPHSGLISGLSEQEGEQHPTKGGLRIGKTLPERGPTEPYDDRLEWERDGQYFHYLTKWMHALDQATRSTGQPQFNRWAIELAATSQRTFTYLPSPTSRSPRMYWKMSIDLTRPLVPSMGQHDPLDGYITTLQLRATAAGLAGSTRDPSLEEETRQYAAMTTGGTWMTTDPLGIGGLLIDAYRIEQLLRQGAPVDEHLLDRLLDDALTGLQLYAQSGELNLPAEDRLAFRELGLAIGLHAVERMWQTANAEVPPAAPLRLRTRLQVLMQHAPIAKSIESFWRTPAHRQARTWSDHRDINEVMLATSLAPEGFLVLPASAEK